jgi:hypothetical protein
MPRDYDVLKQRVEELDGSRRRTGPGRAAVRIDDLAGLLAMPEALKSAKAATDPPTQAEFDALLDDVHMVHTRLRAIVAALRGRLGR